jgi:Family of unknown function (DUF6105)
MRYVLIFWAVPLSLFWGWYFASLNDLGGGSGFFSYAMHRLVFHIYGEVLGVDPSIIPGLAARACVFDTFLIFGILAFRRRKQIVDYMRTFRTPVQDAPREIA